MEYITTKNGIKNNAVRISQSDFSALYQEHPSALENTQLYFDGMSVTVYEYDDDSVTLESTFDCEFDELYE